MRNFKSIDSPIHHKSTDYFYSIDDDENYQRLLEELILSKFKDSTYHSKYLKQLEIASYDKNCIKGDLILQNQQKLVASYINSKTPYRGLVLWHGIGSGKTISSILISKKANTTHNVLGIIPAMLIDNFTKELNETKLKRKTLKDLDLTEHPEIVKEKYKLIQENERVYREKISTIDAEIKNLQSQIIRTRTGRKRNKSVIEQQLLHDISELREKKKDIQKYEKIISDEKAIDEKYYVCSSNGNINSFNASSIDIHLFENALLILDESQIIISKINNGIYSQQRNENAIRRLRERINTMDPSIDNYQNVRLRLENNLNALLQKRDSFVKFYDYICSSNNIKIILLSGTPIISETRELAILFNMLYGKKQNFVLQSMNETIARIISSKNGILSSEEKEMYSEFIKHVDFAKSSIGSGGEAAGQAIICTNPENYENQFDVRTGQYIGMKYVKRMTEFSLLAFLNRLQIVFTTTDNYLFDTSTFLERYRLTMTNFVDNGRNFNENNRDSFPYRLSMSNEERHQLLNQVVMNATIENQDEFVQKTRGLLSYFGNIDKIMPNVNILSASAENTTDTPVSYKIGYNNNGNSLFNVKICSMVHSNEITIQSRTCNNLRNLNIQLERPYEKIMNIGLSKVKKHSEHFIYPLFNYSNETEYYSTIFRDAFQMFLANETERSNAFIREMNQPQMEINPEMQRHIESQQLLQNENLVLDQIIDYKTKGIRCQITSLENFTNSFFDKNFTYLSEHGVNVDLTNYSDKEIENVWDVQKFSRNREIQTSFRVDGDLMKHSIKFYHTIKCILENPDDLHVIYIEYRQIIIPFVRALQANGFSQFFLDGDEDETSITASTFIENNSAPMEIDEPMRMPSGPDFIPPLPPPPPPQPAPRINLRRPNEFSSNSEDERQTKRMRYFGGVLAKKMETGTRKRRTKTNKISSRIPDKSNRYMFLTGASQEGNETDEHRFLKYMRNKSEGKTNPQRKQEYIDLFNSKENINGKKIRLVILNSAAAEGITLKNVRFVHMLHPPSDMSRLFQIFGRAIRTCSHYALSDNQRNLTPYLYLSSYGSDYTNSANMTNDELNYEKIVNLNDRNIPYLQILKRNAIDAPLFNPNLSDNLPDPPRSRGVSNMKRSHERKTKKSRVKSI